MVNRDQQVVFGYLSDPDRIGQKKKNFLSKKEVKIPTVRVLRIIELKWWNYE